MKKQILSLALIALAVFWWYTTHKKSITRSSNQTSVLRVGTNSDYYPYSFIKDDSLHGFDIDLVQAVAERLGKTVEFNDMPFDALIPSAQVGQIQVIAAGITATPERAERILFTRPYLQQDPLLIVSPKEKPITTVDELTHKTVAVNEGYMADLYMSTKQGVDLLRLATPTEAFLALESGRADAFVAARNSIKAFFDKHGTDKFSIAEIPGASDSYSFAISPRYKELLDPIQQALDELTQEGFVTQLLEKWKLQ